MHGIATAECVHRWHKPQSSCTCKRHHSSSRAQRSPSPQILSFPAADAQWSMSAARASVPGSDSVLCSCLLSCQSWCEQRTSQAGGEGQGWGKDSCLGCELQPLYKEVSRTVEEHNLVFLLHLRRKLRLLNEQHVHCWYLWRPPVTPICFGEV